MLSLEAAEVLTSQLTITHGDRFAFLAFENTLFIAIAPQTEKHTPHAPSSPIVDLIQGVYEHNPSHARRIIRNRIYSTVKPTEMCRGMVKLAARRLTAPLVPVAAPTGVVEALNFDRIALSAYKVSAPQIHPLSLWTEVSPPHSDHDFMTLACRLASTISRDGLRYECDRPIAALLVSPTGEILSWGLNSNSRNKTLHAEVNMVQNFYHQTGRALPRGSRIYSTLKPCRMCAGMIWHCAEDITSLRVFFDEFDNGPNARETILNARSQERRRLGQRELLTLEVEHALERRL